MKHFDTIKSATSNSNTSSARLSISLKAILFAFASLLFGFSGAFAQGTPDVDVSIVSPYQASSPDSTVSHNFIFTNNSTNTSDRINIAATSTQGWTIALFDSIFYDMLALDFNGDGKWDYVSSRFDADLNGQPDTKNLTAGAQQSLNFMVFVPIGAVEGTVDTLMVTGLSVIDFRIFDIDYAFTEVLAPITLPVELISFSAKLNSNIVNLEWATATEINNDYFSVERSANGKDFEEILVVRGEGNTNSISGYSIEDKQPLSGVSYYRLKQTDFDGKSETFGAVVIHNSSSNEVAPTISIKQNAYPNPFSESFNLGFNVEERGNVTATIINLQGQVISSEVINTSKGYNEFSYNGSSLPKGIYFLTLENNGNVITSKISKSTF